MLNNLLSDQLVALYATTNPMFCLSQTTRSIIAVIPEDSRRILLNYSRETMTVLKVAKHGQVRKRNNDFWYRDRNRHKDLDKGQLRVGLGDEDLVGTRELKEHRPAMTGSIP